jgi:hypothetical protein
MSVLLIVVAVTAAAAFVLWAQAERNDAIASDQHDREF